MRVIPKKINKLNQRLQSKLWTDYYIDYSSAHKNTILLAGCARSGTTWVSNIINYQNEYRYIFEPFWSEKIDIFKDLELGNAKYLRRDAEDQELLAAIKFVIAGKLRNSWSDKFNQKFIAKKRLIKAVRTNLFLCWLHHKIPSLPIILLLRHPCAVANSRIKLNWETSIDKYLRQEQLVEDFLYPFLKKIQKIRNQGDTFEKAILAWCIENYVPLKQFSPNTICIIFYENICTYPELATKKILLFLGKKYDRQILQNLKIPSPVSRKVSSIIIGENLTNSWKKYITEQQIDRAMEILQMFGLDKIYSRSSLPQSKNLNLLMVN